MDPESLGCTTTGTLRSTMFEPMVWDVRADGVGSIEHGCWSGRRPGGGTQGQEARRWSREASAAAQTRHGCAVRLGRAGSDVDHARRVGRAVGDGGDRPPRQDGAPFSLKAGSEVTIGWPTDLGYLEATAALRGPGEDRIATWLVDVQRIDRQQRRSSYRLDLTLPLVVRQGDSWCVREIAPCRQPPAISAKVGCVASWRTAVRRSTATSSTSRWNSRTWARSWPARRWSASNNATRPSSDSGGLRGVGGRGGREPAPVRLRRAAAASRHIGLTCGSPRGGTIALAGWPEPRPPWLDA